MKRVHYVICNVALCLYWCSLIVSRNTLGVVGVFGRCLVSYVGVCNLGPSINDPMYVSGLMKSYILHVIGAFSCFVFFL